MPLTDRPCYWPTRCQVWPRNRGGKEYENGAYANCHAAQPQSGCRLSRRRRPPGLCDPRAPECRGKLDADLWRENRKACTVDRFSPDPDEKADGWLTRRGTNWFFHYDEEHEGPDEPVYRLGDHTMRLGDYLTIHEADGDDLTYKITEAVTV